MAKPIRFEITDGTRKSLQEWISQPLMIGHAYTYNGKAEILQWCEAASKIQFEEEILSSRQVGAQTIVSCSLTGDFKGSPVNLDFRFEFDGDRISRLEIA